MIHGSVQRAIPAPYALPVGFAMFLAVGTVAAGLHGRLPATGVLIACAAVAGVMSFAAEPVALVLLAGIGWLTAVGFSRPPYAQLRPTGPAAAHAALVIGASALAGAALGLVFRWYCRRLTLVSMGTYTGMRAGRPDPGSPPGSSGGHPAPDAKPGRPANLAAAIGAIGGRRLVAGVILAAAALPLLTAVLAAWRQHLNLADDLLIYLVAVVTITVLGGFWPAVLAAVAASLLLNWYFTEPLHTFTIAEPRNLLALLLFVTVAVAVSSVVHLAARRAVQAARAREEAAAQLELAQTVLGGADSPAAILDHLTRTHGGQAELQERAGGRWVRAASSGVEGSLPAAIAHRHPRRPDPAGHRAGRIGHPGPAGRLRRPGGGRARPGTAPHPGRPGRGAGRGQPDADRAARGGQPRPAHAARLDQGQRQQPAADGRGMVRGRPGRPAGDDRAERGPARRPHRQPARHEPPAHGIAAAVPAPDGDRRGGAGRPARARRLPAARDGGARRLPAGARRSRPARADPGQPVLQRAAVLAARAAARAARRAGRRHGAARGGGPRPGRA